MTQAEALITAARTYLKSNHSYWATRYSKERTGNDYPYTYTDNDYNLFPRYNMLSAILDRVELLPGEEHLSQDALLQTILEHGRTASSLFTKDETNPIAVSAMQEERE